MNRKSVTITLFSLLAVAVAALLVLAPKTAEADAPGLWGKGTSAQYFGEVNFSTDNLSTTSELTLFTIDAGFVVESSLIKVTTANGADPTPTVTLDIGGVAYDTTQSVAAVGGFPTSTQKYVAADSTVTLDGNVALTSGVLQVWVYGWEPTDPNE